MAKLKLSKSGLAEERSQLQLYEKTLPSLDLKRRQLAVELERARHAHAEAREAVAALETRIGEELPMLANPDIEVRGLVKMTAFELGEENVVGVRLPRLERIDHLGKGCRDAGRRAFDRVPLDHDFGTGFEHRAAALHHTDADLGAAQIRADGDGLAAFGFRAADGRKVFGSLLLGAVREIDPKDIHAGTNHRLQDAASARSRTHRGDDLRSLVHGAICGWRRGNRG